MSCDKNEKYTSCEAQTAGANQGESPHNEAGNRQKTGAFGPGKRPHFPPYPHVSPPPPQREGSSSQSLFEMPSIPNGSGDQPRDPPDPTGEPRGEPPK